MSSESARDSIPDLSDESLGEDALRGGRLGPMPLAGVPCSASARACSREGLWEALRAASFSSWLRPAFAAFTGRLASLTTTQRPPSLAPKKRKS